ncbi:hypothetical protein [Leisingera sp. JC11]|uniref:hypothetical protein n=1 Tax=Leisingera sp. JC11 TaxID=3042469 RepID=UPI003453C0BD
METENSSGVTYRLLTGISVTQSIQLDKHVALLPADTSHLDFPTALSACGGPDDIAVVAAFIPRVTAQFRITASSPEELATHAWNSSWDALLLSAVFLAEISFNLDSNTSAERISRQSTLRATSLKMFGLSNQEPRLITASDANWLTNNYGNAHELLSKESFRNAVHCLSSYRWHTAPRVRMAILWAGIEGLFGATSEIRFRLSVCAARFLHPDDSDARTATFNDVKRLYNTRSKAVHGSKTKTAINNEVEESAQLLCKLLRRCIEVRSLPDEKDLLP